MKELYDIDKNVIDFLLQPSYPNELYYPKLYYIPKERVEQYLNDEFAYLMFEEQIQQKSGVIKIDNETVNGKQKYMIHLKLSLLRD